MYEKGKGVKQDDFKALKFLQKACGLNFSGGCYNQGVKLGSPKGTGKSKLDKFKPKIGSLFF
jgi:TPR repeat protein